MTHQPSVPATALPPLIQLYQQLWAQTRSAVFAASATIEAIEHEWKSANDPTSPGYSSFFRHQGLNGKDFLEGTMSSLITRCISLAERQFAPLGGKLAIDRDEINDAFESKRVDAFDPGDVWRLLDARYGGDAGIEAGWQQTADVLRSEFYPESWRKSEPTLRAQTAVFEVHVSQESYSSAKPGMLDYSYHSIGHMVQLIASGLLPFFAHEADAGADGFGNAGLRNYLQALSDMRSTHVPQRHKVVAGSITFTHFKSKIEVSMTKDVFERMNLFIATYTPAAAKVA